MRLCYHLEKPLKATAFGFSSGERDAEDSIAFCMLASEFPYGTLFINIVGSFVMGLLAGLFALKFDPGQTWRLLLTGGILGTLRRFPSTPPCSISVVSIGSMAVYVIASVILSSAALFAGLFGTRQIA